MASSKIIDITKDKQGNIKKSISTGSQNTILNFRDYECELIMSNALSVA